MWYANDDYLNESGGAGSPWGALIGAAGSIASSLLSKKPSGPSVNLPQPSTPQIIMIPQAPAAASSSPFSSPLVIVGGISLVGLILFLALRKRGK